MSFKTPTRGFASDNCSGVCPEALAALSDVNKGHCPSYGSDAITSEAEALVASQFGSHAKASFVFTGTAANVTAIAACLKPFELVLCPDCSHLVQHETGAPSRYATLRTVPSTPEGKIDMNQLIRIFSELKGNGIHSPRPAMVSIAHPTEYGTLYTVDELKGVSDFCVKNGLLFHMDGCRIFNAAVSMGLSLKEMTTDCGVDILSLGGTKNGLLLAEAVVFLKPELERHFGFLRKNSLQLYSKMRFMSCQYIALFSNTPSGRPVWHRNASTANNMASLLASRLSSADFSKLAVSRPPHTNQVFVRAPLSFAERLGAHFSVLVLPTTEVGFVELRFVASFDSGEEDVEALVSTIRTIAKSG